MNLKFLDQKLVQLECDEALAKASGIDFHACKAFLCAAGAMEIVYNMKELKITWNML